MSNKSLSSLLLFLAFLSTGFSQSDQAKGPNILWLVVEDMSPYLASYNNAYTQTPTLDKMAAEGLVFDHAYSNGAQCSPARSTLITGIYAPMLATDWHREGRAIPNGLFYPGYLKKAGYYTTNNAKTDYNSTNVPKDLWDNSNRKASYQDRPDKSKPFFSVFNYNGTHTQRIATRTTTGRNNKTIAPQSIALPPYLPDEPRIRDDIAWHYDAVSIMDEWVAKKLAELEASGEAENTIVFFYSDHGGCLPRAKAFVYETGTKVPLIIRFPEKWKHLAGRALPARDQRLVGFIDFAPTVFNIIGSPIPEHMLGQPFLGKNQPAPKKFIFTYRANQEQSYIPSRAITDGKYRLIWNFNTAYPNGVRQGYQWQMPSYQGWDEAHRNGQTTALQSRFWEPMEALEFYHTAADPYEVNNLIAHPEHQVRIQLMKKELLDFMIKHKDLGLYPWSMRRQEENQAFYDYVRETNQNVTRVIETAAFTSQATKQDLSPMLELMQDETAPIRYWAARGILSLLEKGAINLSPTVIQTVFQNEKENTEVRLACAEILVKHQQDPAALDFILDQVEANYFIAFATLQNLGAHVKPALDRLLALQDDQDIKQFYIRSALINAGYLTYEHLYPEKKSKR